MTNNSPNPSLSIIVFVIITVLYFVIKYILQTKKVKNFSYIFILLVTYISSLIISELAININLTKSLCGSNQWQTAFLVTAIPWILIFGLLNILLTLFPGWLIPFSNTFGYGIAKLGGLNSLLDNILIPQYSVSDDKQLTKALADIYSDRSLLINQIGINNFDQFWSSLKRGKLLQSNEPELESFKQQLKNLVCLKTIIAEFIWFLLAGLLTASASYNMIINSACSHSITDMQKRHSDYQQQIDTENDATKSAPPDRVYSTYE